MKTQPTRTLSDVAGLVTSSLCIIHCALLPLLVSAHSFTVSQGHVHLGETWITVGLDYVFIVIAALAVFHSTRNKIAARLNPLLWIGLLLFTCGILLHENLDFAEYMSYGGSAALITTHLYKWYHHTLQCNNCYICILPSKAKSV